MKVMEEIKLMKGNEAIAPCCNSMRLRRLFWLSHHTAIGSDGDADARKALGNDRNGSVASRK